MKACAQRLWNRYRALWIDLTGWRRFLLYILHYTLLFIVLSHFLFSDFKEANKTFIWTSDGMPVYFTRLVYLSQTVHHGIQSMLNGEGWTIPLYDFRIGPVKPGLSIEPIQWLAVLWPWDRIDVLYDLLVIVRYYLVGFSFSLFGFYFKQKPLPILVGAVSYTFCGFSLYAGVRHPMFMAPMIFLPLLVIGAEKILRKERPYLFITIVFLLLISDLYFSCMLAILIVIYVLIRFPAVYQENRPREFWGMVGRMAAGGGTGIALSGLVMLPTLIQMLDTGRVGRDITVYTNLLRYADSYYQKFLADFLIVPGSVSAWTYLGFSVLTVPAVLMLFFRRDRKKRSLQIMFLVLTGMLLVPGVAYVMSGFNTLSNRWCLSYAFCAAAILMFEIPNFFTADKRILSLVGIGTAIYFVICYFVIDHAYYVEGSFALLACCIFVFAVFRSSGQTAQRYKTGALSFCLLFTCVSVEYSAFLLYDADRGNYISEFTAKGDPYQDYENSQYGSFSKSSAIKNDSTFYRVAGSNISRQSINASFCNGINGLTFYSSCYFQPYVGWIREAELAQQAGNITSHGIQARSPMLTLANVKYYVLKKAGNQIVPYGFQEIERIQNNGRTDLILENQFALPVGYTYDAYLPYEEYEQLSSLGRQEAQLQAVVLKESPNSADIREAVITPEARQIPAVVAESKGLSWKNGVLKVTQEKATITLTFEGLPETETYLRVVDLDLTSGASTRRWSLTAATETTSTRAYFTAYAYTYAHGMTTQLLDLGYTEDGYTTCTITFPSKGTFKLADLEIWCQPMDNYGAQVDALREEVLENVETNWRGLSGTISVSKDKMLCVAVPYDEGWTAYVDGKETKLYQANTAFMAVELPAGDHVVELKYWIPGLSAGMVLSALGAAGLAAIIFYRHKAKKKTPDEISTQGEQSDDSV